MLQSPKIAVTGLGVVSCCGSTVADFWDNIVHGRSGITPLEREHSPALQTKQVGQVKGFKLDSVFESKLKAKTDRHVQFALNATHQALTQSGLDINKLDPFRVHTVIGTCAGGYDFIIDNLNRVNEGDRVMPNFIPGHINNMMSAYINAHYGINGSGLAVNGACAAGNQSVALGAMLIELGMADVVIAGASDTWLQDVAIGGFESIGALSFSDIMPRPFEQARDGFAISEGAGVLILESDAHARQRGADILCYLSGYAISSDGYHPTSPADDGRVFKHTADLALQKAGITSDDIDYVNAHATGTVMGDRIECKNLQKQFQHQPWISATKSMTGHSIGSTGAIESVISVMCIQQGIIPGTINLDTVDPECPGNHLREPISHNVQHVLNNSFGFGGTNGLLIFSK